MRGCVDARMLGCWDAWNQTTGTTAAAAAWRGQQADTGDAQALRRSADGGGRWTVEQQVRYLRQRGSNGDRPAPRSRPVQPSAGRPNRQAAHVHACACLSRPCGAALCALCPVSVSVSAAPHRCTRTNTRTRTSTSTCTCLPGKHRAPQQQPRANTGSPGGGGWARRAGLLASALRATRRYQTGRNGEGAGAGVGVGAQLHGCHSTCAPGPPRAWRLPVVCRASALIGSGCRSRYLHPATACARASAGAPGPRGDWSSSRRLIPYCPRCAVQRSPWTAAAAAGRPERACVRVQPQVVTRWERRRRRSRCVRRGGIGDAPSPAGIAAAAHGRLRSCLAGTWDT